MPPVFIALGPVAAFLFVKPIALRLFSRGDPTGTAAPIFTFLFLLLGAPLILWCVNRMFSHKVRKTILRASVAGLDIENKGLLQTTTTNIPASDILDIDCRSFQTALESAKNTYVNAMPLSQPAPQAQWIFTVLKRLVPSAGIIVKSRHGLIAFGEGLSEIELKYLIWILRKTLAGR